MTPHPTRRTPAPPIGPRPRGSRRGIGLARHGLITVVLFVSTIVATPPWHRHGRGRANKRACFANQKTLAGAREMYALDKNLREGVDLPVVSPAFLEALVQEGYLQSVPLDPGAGPDSAKNYMTVDQSPNGVFCSRHGCIQPPDGTLHKAPRDQLVAMGVLDPLLLEQASPDLPPYSVRNWSVWFRTTGQPILAAILGIATLIATISFVGRGFVAVGSWLLGVGPGPGQTPSTSPPGPPCSICQQPCAASGPESIRCSSCGKHHHAGCRDHVGRCDMFV